MKDIDMEVMFLSSLFVFIFHRILTSIELYVLTRNIYRAICQFLFDYVILDGIRINLFYFKSYNPTIYIKSWVRSSHRS